MFAFLLLMVSVASKKKKYYFRGQFILNRDQKTVRKEEFQVEEETPRAHSGYKHTGVGTLVHLRSINVTLSHAGGVSHSVKQKWKIGLHQRALSACCDVTLQHPNT